MAAAVALEPEWIDLNFGKFSALQSDVTRALCELVSNALDAHQAAGVTVMPELRVEGQDVIISDRGRGLVLSNFAIGRPSAAALPSSSLGQFGLGLKDAVAVLLRERATVTIASSHGDFDFSEREGKCNASTIHVRCKPRDPATHTSVVGTTFRVAGLPTPPLTVANSKTYFLAMLNLGAPIATMRNTAVGTITVYPPSERRAGSSSKAPKFYHMFINGVKKMCSTPLLLQYNIQPSRAGPKLFDRDHNVVGLGGILDAVAEGAEALSDEEWTALDEVAPAKPSCEFTHKSMRDVFFAADTDSEPDVPRALGATRAAAAPVPVSTIVSSVAALSMISPPRIVILYDYENAHNAMVPLIDHVSPRPSWRLHVFAPHASNLAAPATATNVEIVRTSVEAAAEAADTLLCFHAGVKHAQLPSSTAFVIVCGTEGRYVELNVTLRALGHRTHIIRYDNERVPTFVGALTSLETTLGL